MVPLNPITQIKNTSFDLIVVVQIIIILVASVGIILHLLKIIQIGTWILILKEVEVDYTSIVLSWPTSSLISLLEVGCRLPSWPNVLFGIQNILGSLLLNKKIRKKQKKVKKINLKTPKFEAK